MPSSGVGAAYLFQVLDAYSSGFLVHFDVSPTLVGSVSPCPATACSSWGQNTIVMALNIALIGYGKMGREIEAVAVQRGHHIAARVGREGMGAHTFSDVDVAIEFTQPDAAFANVHALLAQGIPTVCGTTGWFGRVPELDCTQTPLVYASNFSLGVNIAFQVNRYLAKLIAPHSGLPGRYGRNPPHREKRCPQWDRHYLGRRHFGCQSFAEWLGASAWRTRRCVCPLPRFGKTLSQARTP